MTTHSAGVQSTDWADAFRAWFEGILQKNGWTREHFGEAMISNLSLAFEEGWKAQGTEQSCNQKQQTLVTAACAQSASASTGTKL
jgi:hypothetical protein